MFFLAHFSSQLSSCLLAVMCIEKFFALYFPLKTRSICTVAMAKRVVCVVILILAGINMCHLYIYEAREIPNEHKYCVNNVPDNIFLIIRIFDSTLYSYSPFTIMILTNGTIIFKFMQSSCAREESGTQSTDQALSTSTNKGTAMLITVSITFLILTTPITFITQQNRQYDIFLHLSFVLLRYINNSINAVLYHPAGTSVISALFEGFYNGGL